MEEFVWLHDSLIPRGQARVSVEDRGFLYGDGLFETLRADAGRVHFLDEHLGRLQASAAFFRLPWPREVDWGARLGRLLAANGLTTATARIKILLSRGVAPGLGLPEAGHPTLVVWAFPYEPPSPGEYAAGWPVVIFPQGRTTLVGRHKSLNYLFYLAARQYALDRGAQEALILEADGRVSEGAATSLVYRHGGGFFTPEAASALPGVTVAVLRRGLTARGLSLETRPTPVDRLLAADGLWLANSLMGVMPVAAVDGQPRPLSPDTALLMEVWAGMG